MCSRPPSAWAKVHAPADLAVGAPGARAGPIRALGRGAGGWCAVRGRAARACPRGRVPPPRRLARPPGHQWQRGVQWVSSGPRWPCHTAPAPACAPAPGSPRGGGWLVGRAGVSHRRGASPGRRAIGGGVGFTGCPAAPRGRVPPYASVWSSACVARGSGWAGGPRGRVLPPGHQWQCGAQRVSSGPARACDTAAACRRAPGPPVAVGGRCPARACPRGRVEPPRRLARPLGPPWPRALPWVYSRPARACRPAAASRPAPRPPVAVGG